MRSLPAPCWQRSRYRNGVPRQTHGSAAPRTNRSCSRSVWTPTSSKKASRRGSKDNKDSKDSRSNAENSRRAAQTRRLDKAEEASLPADRGDLEDRDSISSASRGQAAKGGSKSNS